MSAPETFAPELTRADMEAFVQERLTALYGAYFVMPQFVPGPTSYEGSADTVGPAVAISVPPAGAAILERTYEQQVWAFDIAGDQMDVDSAVLLARQIDKAVQFDTPRLIGNARVLSMLRFGGIGSAGVDNGDRWHYVASYVAQVRYE